ncbi:hypothetical protein GGTG_06304 [Gaeumannomyces tritici R3-111a-1]|uniref:Uncharacterized protein n=1 Tax=Gaeumannomyces tritici (strain R3-111a-1) TaxID=644352 RepID=J3NYF2_GAET3|nr:hypothetical protein GGTG_06304 [Gaeumannomyces tritici R3-111a-1]EJT76385.1 hypothetical protein GGTG_06304 [Gaeumannomyces tritici R3-111a-1]
MRNVDGMEPRSGGRDEIGCRGPQGSDSSATGLPSKSMDRTNPDEWAPVLVALASLALPARRFVPADLFRNIFQSRPSMQRSKPAASPDPCYSPLLGNIRRPSPSPVPMAREPPANQDPSIYPTRKESYSV